MKVLEVGCGNRKPEGAIGLDRVKLPCVDVVHDLNVFPYPFEENSFDVVNARQVIEHLDTITAPMEEFWRILKPGGVLNLETVHYTNQLSWQDPTHKWHLNTRSFLYFTPDYHTNYYTDARFEVLHTRVSLLSIWRKLGLEWLVNLGLNSNKFRFIHKLWEHHLSFVVRGNNMWFKFRKV